MAFEIETMICALTWNYSFPFIPPALLQFSFSFRSFLVPLTSEPNTTESVKQVSCSSRCRTDRNVFSTNMINHLFIGSTQIHKHTRSRAHVMSHSFSCIYIYIWASRPMKIVLPAQSHFTFSILF